MYCIKCGVELADSETRCPLCGTKVYNPEITVEPAPPPFPESTDRENKLSRRGLMLIVTILFATVIAQLVISELRFPAAKNWAGYAIGGVLLGYIILVLPFWFRRPNPVVFVPCDFAAVLLYLLYIDLFTGGHWFLSFVFPAVGAYALLATGVVALCRYVRKGYLYIFGGALIAQGLFMVLLEFLISITFKPNAMFKWSLFPLCGCCILGLGLIIIAICKPIKEALKKKLFF